MYVWSKRFAIAALAIFVVMETFLISQTTNAQISDIHPHTIQFILVNYSLLVLWVFIWMFDQARVRGANVWPWLLPFLLVPVPTLLTYILYLQRKPRRG
jgi:hypothetical protein